MGMISEDELKRLKELESLVGDNDQTEEVHSRITQEDNFAEIPPVEVMNKVNEKKGEEENIFEEEEANGD